MRPCNEFLRRRYLESNPESNPLACPSVTGYVHANCDAISALWQNHAVSLRHECDTGKRKRREPNSDVSRTGNLHEIWKTLYCACISRNCKLSNIGLCKFSRKRSLNINNVHFMQIAKIDIRAKLEIIAQDLVPLFPSISLLWRSHLSFLAIPKITASELNRSFSPVVFESALKHILKHLCMRARRETARSRLKPLGG